MRAWTAFYFVLSCLIAAPLAFATETSDLDVRPSFGLALDGLAGARADATTPSSFNAGIDAAILEGSDSFAVDVTPEANEDSSDLADTLAPGLVSTELPSADSESKMKTLLWLCSLAGMLACVAWTRMIKHNKQVTASAHCKCSRCFSMKTLTSRWRWFELPLWLFAVQPIRCFSCQSRQFVWAWQRWHLKQRTGQLGRHLVPAR